MNDTSHSGFHQHYVKENIVRYNILAAPKRVALATTREEDQRSFVIAHNLIIVNSGAVLSGKWRNGNFALDYWDTSGHALDF